MNSEILDIKYNFEIKAQKDRFYEYLIKYSTGIPAPNMLLTDEWLIKNKKSCYCYQGALWNMYYFNDQGKDVMLYLGGHTDRICHAWIAVDGEEYHVNKPKLNGKEIDCKVLYSKLILSTVKREDIPKLFCKKLEEAYKILLEDTRTTLVSKSRSIGKYQSADITRGKNRFERKKYSKIANTVKQYNQIDMNDLFKKDSLQVAIPVVGETNSYNVTIKMDGVIAEIAKNIKNNNNKLEYRTIIQALTKVFNSANIYVKCECQDYKYRFAHWNIVNNVSVDDSSKDPGPGKGIANPNDDKGRGCKHILLVLANMDWLMKVASVINNYIHYAEEHLQKPFLKVIFPKLYGMEAEEAVEHDLIDTNDYLDSSKGMIDAINAYGRNRGKYKAGTNKNPVTGTGGRTKKEEPKAEPKEEPEENENNNNK